MWIFTGSHSTVTLVVTAVCVSRRAAVGYLFKCRPVCTAILDRLPKFAGTDRAPVQIDESYFSRWCKYNCGRMLKLHEKNGGDNENYDEPAYMRRS